MRHPGVKLLLHRVVPFHVVVIERGDKRHDVRVRQHHVEADERDPQHAWQYAHALSQGAALELREHRL